MQRLRRKEDVKLAILNLPKSLDETYERIFQLLPIEDREFVRLALIVICGSNDLHRPIPVTANTLLQAIIYCIESRYDDLNGSENFGFYSRDLLKDRCGCLVSFSSNTDSEYVSLAHYTVKEFLYSDRISHGSVAYFALSNTLVRTTFIRAVFKIILERQAQPALPEPNSFHFLSIVACEIIPLGEATWDPIWRSSQLKDIVREVRALRKSIPYMVKLNRVFRLEREAAEKYTQSGL